MALFFDRNWFDQALSAAGISHAALAERLGLTGDELADMWKDQREVREADVIRMSEILGQPIPEIASRAGVSTPNPARMKSDPMAEILARLTRLETEIAALRQLIRTQPAGNDTADHGPKA
jgi:transcriptional regulator with XRE-family HTH domain